MQIVDIGVGVAFALTCLSIIAVTGPASDLNDIAQLDAEEAARAAVAGYIDAHGLPFLASSDVGSLCSSVQGYGSAAVVVGLRLDGQSCPGTVPPAQFLGSWSVTLQLPGRTVEVDGWCIGQGQ